jgi:hypothetical protein
LPVTKDTTENLIEAELDKQLSRVVAQIGEGKLPTAQQLNDIDGLSKLKTLFPARDNGGRKKAEIVFLILAATILLCSVYFRVSSTPVELDIHSSNVKVGLTEKRSDLLLPGEHGEIVALKYTSISGATKVDPPWVAHNGGILELPEGKPPSGSAGPNLAVRLQALTIPASGSFDLGIGVAYRLDSRGLVIVGSGGQPTMASFGEAIAGIGAQNTQSAIRSVTVAGSELRIELFPVNTQTSFAALRDITVSNVGFEEGAGVSAILGGSLFVKSLSQSRIAIQPGDHLQIKSDQPMLIRELTFSKGQLETTISAPRATAILLGGEHPQNLMPSYFDWVRSRWPTQLYATLSALVALWLAVKQWWKPST